MAAVLREYRNKSVRAPHEVLKLGRKLLQTHSPGALGDDLWPLLEQTYLAALDMGDTALAGELFSQLDQRFPGSQRVEMLQGVRLEADGELDTARRLYEEILQGEESNLIIWKRLITVYKQLNQVQKAIDSLTQLLDVFYNDLEGWLELAALYTEIFQYDHALQALSHALLLAPQNPFHALQFAETAYTGGDIPLALSQFLRVTELVPSSSGQGVGLRAWLGVKQCIRRIQYAPKKLESKSGAPGVERPGLVDECATERVLEAYDGEGVCVEGKKAVRRWLGA
ncbi:TPR-like protein [Dacryopinax primogenitus]|uniref:ER membrane protein complex subunit 2 n=1 Tax=Dacryopinax primogenitus (strain DJM 731) TaxID=1858805 RepID=M5FY72_DACPD|nr:TPR-like protein [Dacryopinax primogenitus]EJU01484.1 TPR-like protein [Dacryopinax primogenitus]